jgi:two-component system, NarL family, response regulator LiaR
MAQRILYELGTLMSVLLGYKRHNRRVLEVETLNKIKIMIIDDHDMVRQSLSALLSCFDDFEVVGGASNAQIGLMLCHKYMPDVVLMDILMPGMDGVAATQILHKSWPDMSIIALTSSVEEADIHNILQAGAMSYMLKNGSIDEVVDAVRAAYRRHQSTLASQAVQSLISATQNSYVVSEGLTKRQKEVLALMVNGLNNRQIAKTLYISTSTVKNHICSIYAKLNTANRTQTVALAVKNKICDTPSVFHE